MSSQRLGQYLTCLFAALPSVAVVARHPGRLGDMTKDHTAIVIDGRDGVGYDDASGDDENESLMISVTIRFTDREDFVIDHCPRHADVTWLRERVYTEYPVLQGQLLRFVYRGVLLLDGTSISKSGVRRGAVILCAVSDPSASTEAERAEGRIEVVQGFDRFRQAGFSEEDIQSFREQFHATQANWDDDPEALRAREEAWIASLVSPQQSNNDGTARERAHGPFLTNAFFRYCF